MKLSANLFYALIALVPVVFYRGAAEVFEFPKTEVLATGALLLFGAALACEMERARGTGFRAWIGALRKRVASGVRRDPLGTAIALFLLSAVLSSLASIRPDGSFFGVHESEAGLKTAFATATVYFASRSLASDPRHLDRLARAVAAGFAVALGYAVLQITGLDPFPWTRSATLEGVRRVPGTLGHANHLGAAIAMNLPLLGWLTTGERSRPMRVLWVALAVVSLPVLAATLSRGAWVACAAGIVVYGFLSWRTRSRTTGWAGRRLAIAALVLAAAFLLPLFTSFRPLLLDRIGQVADVSAPSTQSRVHLWSAGLRMLRDHPVLGVGTDAYGTAFPRYRTPEYWKIEWNGTSTKAHNELIQIAATQGVIGLLAALLVVLFAARAVFSLSRHGDPRVQSGAAAVGGALTTFAVQNLASFTVASTGVLAAALAGWAAGTRVKGVEACVRPGRGAMAVAGGVVAVLWTLFVLLPWIADSVATPALREPMAAPERVLRLERAATIAPWDARYASELGRSRLALAFSETDPVQKQDDLTRARQTLERATRLSPEDGELRALLARTMAAQRAADRTSVDVAPIKAEFERAIALEGENPNVLELAAQGYLEMGLTAETRAVSLECARLFPDFALPMADIGVAALLEGRPRAAADTLTLALRRNWHGEGAAEMAAKSNYVAALREMRLGDVLKK